MIRIVRKQLYAPALSILAVVLILLVLISISTYRNLDRQKKVTMKYVHRQGLAILDAVEAGTRAGMAMHMWREDSIERLIQEVGSNKDIAYLYLLGRDGAIHHQSDPGSFDHKVPLPQLNEDDEIYSRMCNLKNGEDVYELAKKFTPQTGNDARSLMRQMTHNKNNFHGHSHLDDIIVIGLKMNYFQEARDADIHHAMIMGGIVMALGSAAFFFIFIIQNYYLVEKTLKQTQDYTSQVIASMATGIISIDQDVKITAYNDKALQLLSINTSKIRNIKLNKILNFNKIGINRTLSECITVLDKEVHYTANVDLAPTPLAFNVTPITTGDGGCDGAVIQIRDLSEIKRLEELVRRSEKLAAIGKLAAGIAHEIRNPLSSIRGFTQFLGRGFKPESPEKKYSNIIIKEVDRINRVVTDLIGFAKPLDPNKQETDVEQLLRHTIDLVQSDALSRHVTLKHAVGKDLMPVYLDESQITQALLNLLLNSLQAVEDKGCIQVDVKMNKDKTRLLISVEDDGQGIDREARAKVFDPFYTNHEDGTGLGLPIVHKIVENHGGLIHIDSPPEGKKKGCTFTIELPVAKDETVEPLTDA